MTYYTDRNAYSVGDDSFTIWYHGPFAGCEELSSATFERNATEVPRGVFAGCVGLKEVDIPDTVTIIENYAFAESVSLESVTIPYSVTTIEYDAFYNSISLENVIIPDSVTTIEGYAFSNCTSLPNVTIPESVINIGDGLFKGCSSLESVKLPKGINEIDLWMFSNCASLKTIEIPSSVTSILREAFSGCAALESFSFENDESSLTEIQSNAFQNCTSLKEAILPETVRTIGSYAFQNCTSLEKVYIPQSTKSLGSYAFQKDEALTEVTISDYSITQINDSTFKDCPALGSIVLPKGLTTVGNQAFMNDTALFDVTVPESITSIAANALSYPNKTTIRGKTGSYAETFANDGGFTFVDISVPAEGLALVDGVEYVELEKGQSYRAEFEFFPDDANDVITLTSDKWFVGVEGLDLTTSGTGDATVTATASSGTNYTFTLHVKGVRNIAVTTPPTKTEYELGEAFDPAGMVVTVNFTDNTTKTVADFTVTGYDADTESEQTLRAEWIAADGYRYTTTFNVIVGHPLPPVTGIAITTPPTKLSYEKREALDLAGMVVTATYEDGTTREVTDYTVSGYNPLKTGTQTVTVKYESFTDTFTVEVETSSGHSVHDYSVLQYDGQYHWYKCSGCELTTEKSAHGGGTATCESQAVCDVCGVSYGVLGDHSFEHVKENSTCAEQGFECDVCTVCRRSFNYTNLPLAEHTWNAGTVTTAATCASEGVKTYTCAVCRATKTEPVDKDASNHVGGTEIKGVKAATYTEDGYTGDTYCKGCGAKLSSGKTIPAGKVPTVSAISDKTEVTVGDEITVTVRVDNAVGLEFGTAWLSFDTSLFKLLRTAEGDTSASVVTTCESVEIAQANLDGMIRHSFAYTKWETNDTVTFYTATFKAIGAGTATFGFAADELMNLTVGSVATVTVNASSANHSWDAGKVTTAATCSAEGVKTYTCTVCSETKTEPIAKDPANHAGGTELRNVKAATCGTDGYTGDTYCKGCGVKIASGTAIPATGHSDGNNDGVCDVCGIVLSVSEPPSKQDGQTTVPDDSTIVKSDPDDATTTLPAGDPSGNTTTSPTTTTELVKPTVPDTIFKPDNGDIGSSESTGEIKYSSKAALTKSELVASIVSFEGAVVTVKDKDGNGLDGDATPGTGSTVTVAVGQVTVTKVIVFMGDVDGNASVNASDARLALRAAAKLDTLVGAFAAAADPDSSNSINATDARMILRAAAKLDDPAAWLATA